MPKHPTALPDEVARKLSDLAQEHGYSIDHLTLSWKTKDLGSPASASVTYEPEVHEIMRVDGSLTRAGGL